MRKEWREREKEKENEREKERMKKNKKVKQKYSNTYRDKETYGYTAAALLTTLTKIKDPARVREKCKELTITNDKISERNKINSTHKQNQEKTKKTVEIYSNSEICKKKYLEERYREQNKKM